MSKIVSGFRFLALAPLIAWAAPAAAQSGIAVSCNQAALMDAESRAFLFEKNADEPSSPASTAKIMTAEILFGQIKSGKLSLDQTFTISERAWRTGGAPSRGSSMFASLNSQIRIEDLIRGLLIDSGNDAAIAIAEGIAGTEDAFGLTMTKRAQELGLNRLKFANSWGKSDPNQKTTVREMALLADHVIRTYPDLYKFFSEKEFTWNKITQQNRNPLLKDYPGADGMKTGYTKEAGYGLVGSAVRDGRRLVMVIAGLKSINERKQEAQALLDWGFKQFKPVDVYAKGDRVGEARVWGGTQRQVDLLVADSVRIALSTEEQDVAEVKLAYEGPLMAPVEAGKTVGSVRFLVDGITVADVPVVTAAAVEADESMWSRALDSLFIMVFGS